MRKKELTTEIFVARSKKFHNDRYDYRDVNYVNISTKVKIICKEHGEFWQLPEVHMRGSGCLKCGVIARTSTKTLKDSDLKERFIRIHGRKYGYDRVLYVNTKTNIEIVCPVHGSFFQQPGSHLAGRGCPHCGRRSTADHRRYKEEELVRLFHNTHNHKYSYSKIEYFSGLTPITITCPNHGDFSQTPSGHLQGNGCPKCGNAKISEFFRSDPKGVIFKFNETHNSKYDYSKVVYIGANIKIEILCPTHGSFWQRPADHVRGIGCPKCSCNGQSNKEQELYLFVKSLCPDAEERNRKLIAPKELDIVVPSKNIAIEFNGLYFHSTKFDKNPNKHLEKSKACKTAGYRLIHIYEDDWVYKRQTVEHTLRHILAKSNDKLHARKCTIETRDAKDFFNNYHIQGARHGKSLCLIHNDEIVAAMLFGVSISERGNENHSRYELIRFASKCSIPGAASKLFKHFLSQNPEVKSIISYSDNDMFTGNMYEMLGFSKMHETRPDYKVVVKDKRLHKANFKKSEIAKKYPDTYKPDLTEWQMCEQLGFHRIYNTGLTKWEYSRNVKYP